jgi:hypothetical protein
LLVPDGADGILDELKNRLTRYKSEGRIEESDSDFDDDDENGDGPAKHSMHALLAFPLHAVESVLSTVLMNLKRDMTSSSRTIKEILMTLSTDRPLAAIGTLEKLRESKNDISSQEARAVMTKQALQDILGDEINLSLMCFASKIEPPDSLPEEPRIFSLSGKMKLCSVKIEDHVVPELLLDSTLHALNTVLTSLEVLRTEIQHGEEFHVMRLTTARTKLLSATLCFSIMTIVTSVGSLVTGFFGMNVQNSVWHHSSPGHAWLWIVFSTSFSVIFVSAALVLSIPGVMDFNSAE